MQFPYIAIISFKEPIKALTNNVVYDGKIEKDIILKVDTKIEKGRNTFNIRYSLYKENENIDPIEEVHDVNFKNYGVENGDIYV